MASFYWGCLLRQAWDRIDGAEPTEVVELITETSWRELCGSFGRDLRAGVSDELVGSCVFRRGGEIDWDRLYREL